MAKLYGTMRSEKRSRDARKGGDEKLEIELSNKGIPEYQITYDDQSLRVQGDGGILLETGKTRQKDETQKRN